MSELPPGFVLDHTDAAIPQGFVLDTPSMGEDVAKSAVAGIARGSIGLAGIGGDLAEMGQKGADYLGSKLPSAPSPAPDSALGKFIQFLKDESARSAGGVASGGHGDLPGSYVPPTSAQLQKSVEGVTGEFHKPQTVAGEYAQTLGEFAPGALAGGEGLLARIGKQVVAPAIGSETAAQITKGTAAEPYASVAGALISGGGASAAVNKFREMAAARSAAKAIPTGEQLLKTGGGQFDAARDMNVIVSPDFTAKAAADMRSTLKGFDPEANKAVFAAADRLENLGKPTGPPMTAAQRLQAEMNWEPVAAKPPPLVAMNDVDFIRKELVSLKTSPDGSVRDAARKAIASLQKSQTALTPAETLAGDASAFTKTTQDAIGNWAAGRRSQTIQGKVNLAELNANSPVGMLDSATGGQALQRTMKQLARPVNNTNMPVARKLGFNNQEVSAINEAAAGTKMTHAAELLDRLVPAKLGAVPAMIARQIGGLTTKRQVSALDSLVRSRSPQAAQVAVQLPPQITRQLSPKTQALLSALLASEPYRGVNLGPLQPVP